MYTNPRLKHVKKIMEVADAVSYLGYSATAKIIIDQCNLLLETKKKKKYNLSKSKKVLLLVAKNDNLYRLFEDNTWDVYRSGKLEPSPQPEKCDCGAKSIASNGQCMACLSTCPRKRTSPQPEIEKIPVHKTGTYVTVKIEQKLNEVIDAINIIQNKLK